MRRSSARRARTTRIVAAPASNLPTTADGALFALDRRYRVGGDDVVVRYLNPPAARGEPWTAVIAAHGRPGRRVVVSSLTTANRED